MKFPYFCLLLIKFSQRFQNDADSSQHTTDCVVTLRNNEVWWEMKFRHAALLSLNATKDSAWKLRLLSEASSSDENLLRITSNSKQYKLVRKTLIRFIQHRKVFFKYELCLSIYKASHQLNTKVKKAGNV